jgi:hypothetical protein
MTKSPSSLDTVEATLASRRIKTWPSDWQRFVVDLPAEERRLVGLAVALLDARPADELVADR